MKINESAKILAACAVTAAVVFGLARAGTSGTAPGTSLTSSQLKHAQNPFPQPDTTSAEWRSLSDDLGIWIAKPDKLGVRGRLYVRAGGSWWPVAVDGLGDINGVFPAH